MVSGKKFLPWLLLSLALIFSVPAPACFAQQASAPAKRGDAGENPQPRAAPESTAEQGGVVLRAEDMPVPINAEKIDEAGQALGKKIDAVGRGASARYGRWVNAKAIWGITWLKLFVCFGLILLVVAIERTASRLISTRMKRREQRSEPTWGDLLLQAVSRPLSLFIRVYGIYWALSPVWGYLDTPGSVSLVHRAAGKAADLGGTVAFFWFVYLFIQVLDIRIRKWAASTDNGVNDMLVPLISKTVRGFVVVVGGIMVVQNMTGIEIGPLVASLGIGGLAIALAGKDSIANFLGSLTILLDKPFQVGERIFIDKHEGIVEGVGFRSTRLRTLTGNLVSIPNEKIINSTLENIGKRTYLRWRTDLGLTYETPPEKVERAVEIIRDILRDHPGADPEKPPRVYFNGFNDWSLNISIHAWYSPADYWKYQDWLQATCLEILRRLREEGIDMAFPTQTLYHVAQENTAALDMPRGGRK